MENRDGLTVRDTGDLEYYGKTWRMDRLRVKDG
jgi:hypothetical protein